MGHGRAAVGTGGRGRLGEFGRGFADLAADQIADEEAGLAGRAGHPSVVAHPHEALGQDMGEEAIQEGVDLEEGAASVVPRYGGRR